MYSVSFFRSYGVQSLATAEVHASTHLLRHLHLTIAIMRNSTKAAKSSAAFSTEWYINIFFLTDPLYYARFFAQKIIRSIGKESPNKSGGGLL
jgi:hypothetical protein